MGPKLPERASDYTFYKDRTNGIYAASRGKPLGMGLSKTDLDRTVFVRDSQNPSVIKEQYNLYDEVKDFCVFDKRYGQETLGINNQMQYSLFMQCQVEADANQDGVFSEEEYTAFKDKLKAKNLGIMPNCATIEGLYPKEDDVKKSE